MYKRQDLQLLAKLKNWIGYSLTQPAVPATNVAQAIVGAIDGDGADPKINKWAYEIDRDVEMASQGISTNDQRRKKLHARVMQRKRENPTDAEKAQHLFERRKTQMSNRQD